MAFREEGLAFVDSEEAFEQMLAELEGARAVAVDLEHHSEHSYVGVTCLLQLSVDHKDWVVDPFPLWRQMPRLQRVFGD